MAPNRPGLFLCAYILFFFLQRCCTSSYVHFIESKHLGMRVNVYLRGSHALDVAYKQGSQWVIQDTTSSAI